MGSIIRWIKHDRIGASLLIGLAFAVAFAFAWPWSERAGKKDFGRLDSAIGPGHER